VTERKFHPLCERLADVLASGLKAELSGEEIAQDIIDAIDASGIAWVAPWEATQAMVNVPNDLRAHVWAAQRDACLAERS
jgi:hypothetical protein